MRRNIALVGTVSVGVVAACGAGTPPPAPPPAMPVDSVLGAGADVVAEVDGGSGDGESAEAAPAAPTPYVVIAKNLHASAALAVDANAIYWVDEAGGEVSRAPTRRTAANRASSRRAAPRRSAASWSTIRACTGWRGAQ